MSPVRLGVRGGDEDITLDKAAGCHSERDEGCEEEVHGEGGCVRVSERDTHRGRGSI